MLTKQDQEENILFRGGDLEHNKNDPLELIARVAAFKKPVAGIVIKGLPRRLIRKIENTCRDLSLKHINTHNQ